MAKNKIVDLVFPFLGPLIAPVLKAKSLTIVGFLVCILAIIIVPLPSPILDFFLALSIALFGINYFNFYLYTQTDRFNNFSNFNLDYHFI